MIYIDKKLNGFLDYVKMLKTKNLNNNINYEFEIRITDNNNLKKGITKANYDLLYNKCIKQKFTKKEVEKSVVSIYSRKINGYSNEYREIETEGKQTICQIKTKPEKIDNSYSNFNIRYSLSIEEDIICPDRNNLVYKRNRERVDFDSENGYVFMFTKVFDENDVIFEVEIEFDIDKLDKNKVEEVLLFLSSTLSFYSNVENEKYKEILKTRDAIVKYANPVKPRNIEERDSEIINKNEYKVTNKLDGERYYIFFNQGKAYAIQNDHVIQLNYFNDKDQLDSFIDSEFFKGKYYFFDCYLFTNNYTYEQTLTYRLQCCELLSKNNTNLFVMKVFSNELLKETIHLLDILNKDENDGLIYTPENPNIKLPILKWKFPDKMSIDFLVKQENDTTFILNVKDKKGITPFLIDGKPAIYITDKIIKNEKIYEFTYKQDFILLRERTDKQFPNFITVANSVWKDIIHPFESFKLINMFKPLRKYRKYHNKIKDSLISEYCKNKKILDLGVGAGGDLYKYSKTNIKELFGVEPYNVNYQEFEKRIKENPPPFKVKLLKVGAEDTDDLVKVVGIEGVDIVSSFFSLSFFFFNGTDSLDKLVDTISENLKEDGYFIGTTIDGKRTTELLLSFSDKTFDFGEGFIRLNKDNTVSFEIKGTIVETQLESLVDFELLTNKLESVGIFLEKSDFFKDNKDLSTNENKLNSLYRTFVFRKHNMTTKINKLCDKNTIYDLITRSTDEKCFELFKKLNKNCNIIDIKPNKLYDSMNLFYIIKSKINKINSFNLLKVYSLFGNRMYKSLITESIPKNSINIFKYKNKEDYNAIREQIVETLLKLKEKNISYNDLLNLLVSKDETGFVKVIFYNYNFLNEGEFEKDEHDFQKILEYLSK